MGKAFALGSLNAWAAAWLTKGVSTAWLFPLVPGLDTAVYCFVRKRGHEKGLAGAPHHKPAFLCCIIGLLPDDSLIVIDRSFHRHFVI
jgi:hypothetical protein